jgi:type IV pilus assembly protein PilA
MKDLAIRLRARAQTAEIEGEEVAEAGFTLIELMVVLLIIAILLAIAIPTFLGVTNSATDRAAQSNLTNALTEGKTLYQVNAIYTTAASAFNSQAPEFTWQTTACATTATNCVSMAAFDAAATGDVQGLSLAVDSVKTNTCWYAFDLEATPSSAAGTPLGTGGSSFPSAGVFYAKSATIPTGGCVALNPDSHSVTITTGGQNYSNAPVIS